MAKAVLVPRLSEDGNPVPRARDGCAYRLHGRTIILECSKCQIVDDPPSEVCLGVLRSALNAYRDASEIMMVGPHDVWIRENGVSALRSFMAAEMAREELRSTLMTLHCPDRIAPERVARYLDRVSEGASDLFCSGQDRVCVQCRERQRQALDAFRYNIKKAKKAMAANRFRIMDVPGGADR